MKDYYQALGIGENASEDEIKKAYRSIAKKHHPDKNPGDKSAEDKFKEASEAYDTLGDKTKRAKYDRLRKLGGGGFGNIGGASGDAGVDYEEFMRRYGGANQAGRGQRTKPGEFSFEDLFGNLFGGREGERTSKRESGAIEPQATDDPFFKRLGNDAYVEVKINLGQALIGSKIAVRTPAGKRVTLKIKPGIDIAKALRVPSMGYESGSKRGDLYVRLRLALPTDMTPEQTEAAKQFIEALGLKY